MRFKNPLIICILVSVAVLISTPAFSANALHLKAKSAILMDVGTGKILYAQNPDRRIPPASITKVLSLYLVYEALHEGRLDPAQPVRISHKAWRTGGSRMHIRAGHNVPLSELMKGMAVVSGNDASIAIAEHMGGVREFVKQMNDKARELGMTRSTFKNPNGLPAKGQFTTARDVLKLSHAYLSNFPECLEVHSMKYFTYQDITQRNHNRLVIRRPEVDGLKTGYIRAAGFHVVVTAKRGGTRLIAVVMGAKNPRIREREATRLIEEGFRLAELEQKKTAA